LKILELFCGTKSITKVFNLNGWDSYTVDVDNQFHPTLCKDVMLLEPENILKDFGHPDIIWASPPCTAFSVASMGYHWTGGKGAFIPKTEFAKLSKELVIHTIELIQKLNPKYSYIENPRGALRKMPFMQDLSRYTVTYCQYGDTRMKPTDIWTNHPLPNFKPMCHNGDTCHQAAPRGAKTGTQGLKGAIDRSVIPQELCEHIFNISSQ